MSKIITEYMLTTADNPWDPFTQYDEWKAFDEFYGYNSNEKLARKLTDSIYLSHETNEKLANYAITQIVVNDPLNIYKRVSREVEVED